MWVFIPGILYIFFKIHFEIKQNILLFRAENSGQINTWSVSIKSSSNAFVMPMANLT